MKIRTISQLIWDCHRIACWHAKLLCALNLYADQATAPYAPQKINRGPGFWL